MRRYALSHTTNRIDVELGARLFRHLMRLPRGYFETRAAGQIGVVPQENLLFNRTNHDNIALANPALPRGEVMRVAQLAGALEFIVQLPQGYDTVIEERGSNLPGGQRQRIAIARALSTLPRILILDEATSVLDYESERIVQQNMREIVRDRTVIIVAHDAIPADAADQALADPTRKGDRASQSLTPSAKPMTDLVFETRLRPDMRAIDVNGTPIALAPGMTVTVEVKTGTRRILEYLFSPLLETTGKAMRER